VSHYISVTSTSNIQLYYNITMIQRMSSRSSYYNHKSWQ